MGSENRVVNWGLAVLNVLAPAVVVWVVLELAGKSVSDCLPVWGDEIWWWKQAEAVGVYGKPLGFWGYNGGRAQIGTYAAWGPAMVLPYGMFAFLFGWKYSSFVYANIFWEGIATAVYIKLTKVKQKGMVLLLAFQFFFVVKNYFLIKAMAECVRYSLGIIAISFVYYVFSNEKCGPFFKYFFVPLYLVYITQAYLIFGIFFLVYVACVFRIKRGAMYLKAAGTIGCFSVYMVLSKKILRLFCSPYPEYTQTLPEKVYSNIKGIILIYQDGKIFFQWFLTVYLLVMAVLAVTLFYKRKCAKKKDQVLRLVSFLILSGFFWGHILFYNTTAWTFIRGLAVGMLLSFCILCLADGQRVTVLFLLLIITGILVSAGVSETFINENRFIDLDWQQNLNMTRQTMENILVTDLETADPWDHTVAAYETAGLNLALALPAGFALNAVLSENVYDNAKYAVVGKKLDQKKERETVLKLLRTGYIVKYEDKRMAVLKKRAQP